MQAPGRSRRRTLCGVLFVATLAAACGPRAEPPPQVTFWNSVRDLCGQAFEGRAVELTAVDSAIAGQRLVLDVWQCYHDELRLVFHVGGDHSRVWRLTRDQGAMHLSHDVHTAAGAPAAVTGYGGEAADPGTANRQTFQADDRTVTRIPSADGSEWTLEIEPRERLEYAFRSADGTVRFRVEFDVSRRLTERPPAPWGLTRRRAPAS